MPQEEEEGEYSSMSDAVQNFETTMNLREIDQIRMTPVKRALQRAAARTPNASELQQVYNYFQDGFSVVLYDSNTL